MKTTVTVSKTRKGATTEIEYRGTWSVLFTTDRKAVQQEAESMVCEAHGVSELRHAQIEKVVVR